MKTQFLWLHILSKHKRITMCESTPQHVCLNSRAYNKHGELTCLWRGNTTWTKKLWCVGYNRSYTPYIAYATLIQVQQASKKMLYFNLKVTNYMPNIQSHYNTKIILISLPCIPSSSHPLQLTYYYKVVHILHISIFISLIVLDLHVSPHLSFVRVTNSNKITIAKLNTFVYF